MSFEERRRKRQNKRRNYRILITVLSLYLILRLLTSIFPSIRRTAHPEQSIWVEALPAQGVVIKDEKLIQFEDGNKIDLEIDEGERVAAGSKIAKMDSNNSTLGDELREVDDLISTLKELDSKGALQEDDSQDNIHDISEEEYKELTQLVNQKNTTNSNTLSKQSLRTLEENRKKIMEQIKNNNYIYTATDSGILSYNIDGYEQVLLPNEFENYTYHNLDLDELKGKNNSKKDNKDYNGVKIINNLEWYIAIKIEDKNSISQYEVNDNLTVELLEEETEITGQIVSVNNTDKHSVILVKFNSKLHDFYNIRFPELNIVKSKQEGYKIPNKSLVDRDGEKGVYIKDFSGIIKFRPVSIIGEIEDYTFVDKGDSNGYINIETQDEKVKTISLYDEFFLNPKRVKEGDILD